MNVLEDALNKISWAEMRFRDLAREAQDAQAESESHGVVVKYDPQQGCHVAFTRQPGKAVYTRLSLLPRAL